jgi:hypothetical protein
MTMSADQELQGWYYRNGTSDAERVRLSFVGGSLALHTLSNRLVATWSLSQLENGEIAVLGGSWSIGDRRLPDSCLKAATTTARCGRSQPNCARSGRDCGGCWAWQ